MMKWMFAAGAAALAISSPVQADKGGHGGKGQGAQQAQANRGGGQKQARSGHGGGDRQVSAKHGGGDRQVRAARSDHGSGQAHKMHFAQTDNRGRGNDRVKTESHGNHARVAGIDDNRGHGHGRDDVVRVRDHGNRMADFSGNKVFRVRDVDRGVVRFRDVDRDDLFVRRLGYGAGGCPPGLAKKAVACVPPGQAARFVGQPLIAATRFAALDPMPRSFNNLFWDNDDYYYRYGGGYVYRVDRDRDMISGLIPLFGAALIGQPLGQNFINPYNQPSYYSAFYPNSPYDCHQYGYGYVYETDCMTGMVEDVIPTYAYGYGVGQIMPSSYSYYNVPYAYRSSFADNDDYYYRYAPGAIYQVDRSSALISSVAALLTGGLTVGQPLPMGYSAYNVPLAYRSSYYDTPDMLYRYDNGYIYGINPQTRVVSNVAYVVV